MNICQISTSRNNFKNKKYGYFRWDSNRNVQCLSGNKESVWILLYFNQSWIIVNYSEGYGLSLSSFRRVIVWSRLCTFSMSFDQLNLWFWQCKRTWVVVSGSELQLPIGFTVFRRLCLIFCSMRWLNSDLSEWLI